MHMKRVSSYVLWGLFVLSMLALLGAMGWTMYQKSTSSETYSVELKSSSSSLLGSVTGSLTQEVLGIDPVINPTANVVVQCDGTGYAELDNRRSTTGLGFEVLVGDEIVYRFVEGGDMLTVTFIAPPGTTVTAQTGEGIPYAIVPVPICSAAR